jgi:hypothetical protein
MQPSQVTTVVKPVADYSHLARRLGLRSPFSSQIFDALLTSTSDRVAEDVGGARDACEKL